MLVTRDERDQIGSVHGLPSTSRANGRHLKEKDKHRREREPATDQDERQKEDDRSTSIEARRSQVQTSSVNTHQRLGPLAIWNKRYHRDSDSPYARNYGPGRTASTGIALDIDHSGELAQLARSSSLFDSDLARYGIDSDEMPLVATDNTQRSVNTRTDLKRERKIMASQQEQQHPTTMPGGLDSLRGYVSDEDELDVIGKPSPQGVVTRGKMERQVLEYQPKAVKRPDSRTAAPPPVVNSNTNTNHWPVQQHHASGSATDLRSHASSSSRMGFEPPRRAIVPVYGAVHSQRHPFADNLSGPSLPQRHGPAPNANGRHNKSQKRTEDDDHSSAGRGRAASGSRETAGARVEDAIQIDDDEVEERPRHHREPVDGGRHHERGRSENQRQHDEMYYTATDARNGVHKELGLLPGGSNHRPASVPLANGKPVAAAEHSTQRRSGLDYVTKRAMRATPPPTHPAPAEKFIDLDDDEDEPTPAPARGEDPEDRISSPRAPSPETRSADREKTRAMLAGQVRRQVPTMDFSSGKAQMVSTGAPVKSRMKLKTDISVTMPSSSSTFANSMTATATAARSTRGLIAESLLHGKPSASSSSSYTPPPAVFKYPGRSSQGEPTWHHGLTDEEEEEEEDVGQPIHHPPARRAKAKTSATNTPKSEVHEISSDHSHAPSPPPTPIPTFNPRTLQRPGKDTPAPPLVGSPPDTRESLRLHERYAKQKPDPPISPKKEQRKRPPRNTFMSAMDEIRAQDGPGQLLSKRNAGAGIRGNVKDKAKAFDALDGVSGQETRKVSKEMPPPSTTTRGAKGKGKAKEVSMVVAPIVACALGDDLLHEEHNQLYLVVEPGKLRVTLDPRNRELDVFIVGSRDIIQMQMVKNHVREGNMPGLVLYAKNSDSIPVSAYYDPGDAIIIQLPERNGWGNDNVANGWADVEAAIMNTVMNLNNITVTFIEPPFIVRLLETVTGPEAQQRREQQVLEQAQLMKGHSKARAGGAAKEDVVPKRGSKKDAKVDPKQSTLSFASSRRNSTTTSMADDDVVEATLGPSKNRGGVSAELFYGSRRPGNAKSRSVSASASAPEEGEAGADAAQPSILQSLGRGVSGLFNAARRIFPSGRPASRASSDTDRPSHAPSILRKRKATGVVTDDESHPDEHDFFSDDGLQDSARTGDGTMARMYSGRRTRSSAGHDGRLEGMLGGGKPKRAEWDIDRRLPDEVIAVYPPTGPGALNLTRAERFRLDDGEFLNDTLIEYGLKRWLLELQQRDPAKAEMVHVFSSFFYKKLNVRKEEDGYQSVRKWTNKVDIFKKRFIIVPINENAHWYLAIVYNPEYILEPPPPQDSPQTRHRLAQEARENVAAVSEDALATSTTPELADGEDKMQIDYDELPGQSVLNDSLTPSVDEREETSSPAAHIGDSSIADRSMDLRAGDQSSDQIDIIGHMDEDEMDVDEPVPAARPESRYDPKLDDEVDELADDVSEKRETSVELGTGSGLGRPAPADDASGASSNAADEVIATGLSVSEQAAALAGRRTYVFTFDSLGGTHKQVQTKLDYWLLSEAETKRSIPRTACSRSTLKKFNVPTQPNYCDCGLYLIHFVETFMADPDKFIVWQLTNWKKNEQPNKNDVWNHKNVETARPRMMEQIEELVSERKARLVPVVTDQPLANNTPGSAAPTIAKGASKEVDAKSQASKEGAEESESDVELIEGPAKPIPPLKPGRTGRKK